MAHGTRRHAHGHARNFSPGLGDDWLTGMAMVAPAIAQSMMLVVMLANGQWMFAVMIAPGLVTCLMSLLVSHRQRKRQRQMATDGAAFGGCSHSVPLRSESAAASLMPEPAPDWASFVSPPLEQLLGVDTDPLMWRTVARRWLEPTMTVPLGTGPDGTMSIDLTRQGPHALVAGTTGSGKSVLLQSWCLALAATNPPDRLNFVFMDFKGGAAFRPLETLPHTVGNVCDLNLRHATRALVALERELKRRERLVASMGVGGTDHLREPPPRLLVVIDEFHALKDQLPDYVDRLVRVASLGRSLGMHLIACTQNPIGQVNADMKANMALNLCLRVRDAMQSMELLGNSCAAAIPPSMPGGTYMNDGERMMPWRCAVPERMDTLIEAIGQAAAFHGSQPGTALFTAPLPATVRWEELKAFPDGINGLCGVSSDIVAFGLADDGIGLRVAGVRVGNGNIGIFGSFGRGKTTLLRSFVRQLAGREGLAVRMTQKEANRYRTVPIRGETGGVRSTHAMATIPPRPHLVWVVDDADALLDPFSTDALAGDVRRAIADPQVTVVFAAETQRHVRVPEQCPHRLVLPTGDKPTDQLNGVPADLWQAFDRDDFARPGRAVWLNAAHASLVQCTLPP